MKRLLVLVSLHEGQDIPQAPESIFHRRTAPWEGRGGRRGFAVLVNTPSCGCAPSVSHEAQTTPYPTKLVGRAGLQQMGTDGWGEGETTRQYQQHDVCSPKHGSSRALEAMENSEERLGSFGMLAGGLKHDSQHEATRWFGNMASG